MTETELPLLNVRAIPGAHLAKIRNEKVDGHGNRLVSLSARGEGEPLRCCLRYARAGEEITLISYAPFERPSVWREVGPVYIHAGSCEGYRPDGRLPSTLAKGPRVLRTYDIDGSLDYEHITVVNDPSDLTPIITGLIYGAGVPTVHVRTLGPQCFLFEVGGFGSPPA